MIFHLIPQIARLATIQLFLLVSLSAQDKACSIEHTALYDSSVWYAEVKKNAPQAPVNGFTPVIIAHKQSAQSTDLTETLFVTPLFDTPPGPFSDYPIAGYQILIFNHKHRESPRKIIWKKDTEKQKIEKLWEVSSDLTIKAEYGAYSKRWIELFEKGVLHSSMEYYIMAKHRKADQMSLGGGFMTGFISLPDPNTPAARFQKVVDELFALANED